MSFDELIDRHRGVGHGLYFVRITQKGIPGIPFFFFVVFDFIHGFYLFSILLELFIVSYIFFIYF